MAGDTTGGLTVVISPLQSLMKDQVDNLESNGITSAVSINGLLDPIERSEAVRRVVSGEAKLLYISPESLRSMTLEKILAGRKIERFVIDEAHCFSAWGQDFRVDYLYIGEFIKRLNKHKNLHTSIPVSCFTATAKQSVIDDITNYFKEHLDMDMILYTANISRKNLSYKVIECDKESKYEKLRLLLEEKRVPTIIYVSKTLLTEKLASRLKDDGFNAGTYHGKMDKQLKSQNQERFIKGELDIMVATSAFGMGVDKSDVELVIHYQVSNSLENYIQEAGRAGRDQEISAECFILYDDNDLNEHFTLLNQTKLGISEIGDVWKAIKGITRVRKNISYSALEIARKAGWDDNVYDVETRVKTAITALEQAGYLKRGHNSPRVYADSILSNSVIDAAKKIRESKYIDDKDKENAVRMIKMMIAAKNRKVLSDEASESRLDYVSDHLGIDTRQAIRIVSALKEEGILADVKDLSAFLNDDNTQQKSSNLFKWYSDLEQFLISRVSENDVYNIKDFNEEAEALELKKVTTDKIITLLNIWAIKGWIKKDISKQSRNYVKIELLRPIDELQKNYDKRSRVCSFVLDYLYEKNADSDPSYAVQFSVNELKDEFNFSNELLDEEATIAEIENALFYLSRIGSIKIEGGFLVTYNKLQIERLELDNRIKYKKDDYKTLKNYYEQKKHQIHIVGEYAKKMIENYAKALNFVDDYFSLDYKLFLSKYFNGAKNEMIHRGLTEKKFNELFSALSVNQLDIIKDKESRFIVVAAGPGSGKTRILVHKLASLLLMEDVKHEQLLMLTFSRASAIEFKKRLKLLIGNSANYIEIKTFHSYCFDLLGKVGNVERSENIVKDTIQAINSGEVEKSRFTKTVMVIDEAQDMDRNEFEFVRTMVKHNEEMRIIAVGDDDQNIYTFRGSSSEHMKRILVAESSKLYELVENYRSNANLIQLSNNFAGQILDRMKVTPIIPVKKINGKIEMFHYKHSCNMITNIVDTMLNKKLEGVTCILTQRNYEALQIVGLLKDQGIYAKLIQGEKKIRPIDLDEVNYFINVLKLDKGKPQIDKSIWNEAKKSTFIKFERSTCLSVVNKLLRDFEETCGEVIYASDFLLHVRESKLEDFMNDKKHSVYVSTIHKSKGREFDNVIAMIDSYNPNNEEGKRNIYVALTRAKNNLDIHYQSDVLNEIFRSTTHNTKLNTPVRKVDGTSKLFLSLGHEDVFLSYSYEKNVSELIEGIVSGDELSFDNHGCYVANKKRVLIFSKKIKNELKKYTNIGYSLHKAKVRYVVHWKAKEKENSVRVIFPTLELIKR
jgi:ATP-dependent DNA helicase RecQ